MSQSYQTGFRTTLAAKLSPADTTATLATVPTVTVGRLLLQSGTIKEWVSFTGVSGSTVTGLTRGLSQTADPDTAGTGLTWVAGTQVVLVAMHDQLLDKTQDSAYNVKTVAGVVVNSLTTTQRDALASTSNGSIIYNTTAGEFQIYQAGSWSTMASGSTQPNASTTVAGKVEIATTAESIAGTDTGGTGAKLVVLPSDIAANTQSSTFTYKLDTGSVNALAAVLVPAATAYTTGMLVRVKAANTNTSTSVTLNVNGLGTKTVTTITGVAIPVGSIVLNGMHDFIYDGTNFQLINPNGSAFGDGSDGALSTSSGTTTLSATNGLSIKQYTNATISGTAILDCQAEFNYIYVSGTFTMSAGTIKSDGRGGAGGAAQTTGTAGKNAYLGVGFTGGIAGASITGAAGGASSTFSLTNSGSIIRAYSGGGGGGGMGGPGASAGGAGGAGGGVIVIIANAVNFTGGTIQSTGAVGSVGSAAAGGGGSGGGGGGGAGTVVILYGSLVASSGTIVCTGGAGGAGGAIVSSSGSSDGAGGGGGGGGFGQTGGAGGNGQTGTNGTNGFAGTTATSNAYGSGGAGGAGGAGFGGANNAAGGGGGGGGGAGAYYVVKKI